MNNKLDYISLKNSLSFNTKMQATDEWGVKKTYDFIIPAPDHKEEKAYCDKHRKEYTKISYTLTSGKKYVSECERCESIKYHQRVNKEREREGYPTFNSKQEMEAHFTQQKEDEIKQKNEKIEYQYKKGL